MSRATENGSEVSVRFSQRRISQSQAPATAAATATTAWISQDPVTSCPAKRPRTYEPASSRSQNRPRTAKHTNSPGGRGAATFSTPSCLSPPIVMVAFLAVVERGSGPVPGCSWASPACRG